MPRDCSKMLLSRPIMKGALIFALLLTAPAFSREDTPLRPVRITATVIDRVGKPLTGLTLKDFSLLDQGVAQPLQSVEARKPGPRRLAILLDEFHVDPADTDRVRAALITFADQQLRPDDMVVVLKPLDSLPSIRLSNDRDAIKKAIADFAGRQGIYAPRTPLEEEAIGRAPALAERARAQVVLSALRELASRLGSVAGRSAILIVSSGFRQSPAAVPARTLPDAGIVERFANRYDVPVYGFDPGAAAEATADDSQVLASLAAQTGGTFNSAPDLDGALRQVARELDSGYLLTFNPSGKDDGKFHTVTVRTSRRGAQVRARAGYVSPPPPESRSASRFDGPDAGYLASAAPEPAHPGLVGGDTRVRHAGARGRHLGAGPRSGRRRAIERRQGDPEGDDQGRRGAVQRDVGPGARDWRSDGIVRPRRVRRADRTGAARYGYSRGARRATRHRRARFRCSESEAAADAALASADAGDAIRT